jgi:hypothetical protein
MDPTRDNPVIRFNTFWWMLWAFMIFAVLLAVIMMYNRKPPSSLAAAAAVARYATKQKILAAAAVSLSMQEIEAAIPAVAAALPTSKPGAVETPGQAVPGSLTARKLAAAADGTATGASPPLEVVPPAAPATSPPAPTAP